MEKIIYEFEALEIEAQGLTGISIALLDAMKYSPNGGETYIDGLEYFATLMFEYTDKMANTVKMAFEEGGNVNG